MTTAIDLDHVAVAVERQTDAWPRYAGDLSGRWVAGGHQDGFGSAQVHYANGMRLEVLEPFAAERNDFLRRFLDRSGPGPHHLTFKVPDIRAVLDAAADAGLRPVGVDLRDPGWKEAFLHPREAHGVVVQVAQSTGGWTTPPPDDLPRPRTAEPATLDHVAHTVADLDAALVLFSGLLGGEETTRGRDDAGGARRWVELRWTGPGRLRLVEPCSTDVLDGRPGAVHHLRFAVEDPAGVAGAVRLGDDGWEVAPEHNLGTRLRLAAPAPPGQPG